MLEMKFSPNRIVSSVSHAALAAGGAAVALTLISAVGLTPDLLNSRIRAAFGVAAYAVVVGAASYRASSASNGPAPRGPTNG